MTIPNNYYKGVPLDELNLYPKERIIESLDLVPQTRDKILESETFHGTIFQGLEFQARDFSLDCYLSCDSIKDQRASLVTLFNLLWPPSDGPLILEEKPDRHINCRLNGEIVVPNTPLHYELSIPLIASDPFFYSLVEHEQEGAGEYENKGTGPAYPLIEITGPCVDPIVTINGLELKYIGSLSSLDVLRIDTKARTARFNGVFAKSYNKRYTIFKPGINNTEISSGNLKILWRDSWL